MGLESILIVLFLFVSIAVVGLVLMQHGKGADAGAAFGSGASATVFGSQGSANFLSRATGILAAVWFVLSMTLAWFAIQANDVSSIMDDSVMNQESDTFVPPVSGPASPVPAPMVDSPVSAADTIPSAEVAAPAAADIPAAIETPAATTEAAETAVEEKKPGQ